MSHTHFLRTGATTPERMPEASFFRLSTHRRRGLAPRKGESEKEEERRAYETSSWPFVLL